MENNHPSDYSDSEEFHPSIKKFNDQVVNTEESYDDSFNINEVDDNDSHSESEANYDMPERDELVDTENLDGRCLEEDKDGDILVLEDSDLSDREIPCKKWLTVRKKLPFEMKENVQLTLYEAFFLSYALGVLVIKNERLYIIIVIII